MSAGQALSGAGGTIGAIGGFFGRRARAKSLMRDARIETEAGEADAADRLREGNAALAAGSVAAASSGFTGEGSATDVLAMLARDVNVSSRRARWDAGMRSQRLKNEATQLRKAAPLALAGDLIATAGQVASMGAG